MIFIIILSAFFIAIVSVPVRFIIYLKQRFKAELPMRSTASFPGLVSDICCLFGLPAAYLFVGEYELETIPNGAFIFGCIGIIGCIAAYFKGSYDSSILPFLQEFGQNLLLGMGIAINLYIAYDNLELEIVGNWLSTAGNGPIILLFVMALLKRHDYFFRHLPFANDALRQARADVLDYLPSETDAPLRIDNLGYVEGIVVRALAGPLYLRLAVFIMGGFLLVSAGILIKNLIG